MRIPKKFGERTPYFKKPQKEKRKYILAYEGQATEVQYFQGLIDNRASIGIDPIIDLLPVLRSIPQESHSHPKKILKLLEEHIENYDTVKVLIDKMIDYFIENQLTDQADMPSMKSLAYEMECFLKENFNLSLEDKIEDVHTVISELTGFLLKKPALTALIEKIADYIEEQQILYSEDQDYICLIIDRDKGSMKPDQYMQVIEKCKEKKIRLFVTNPSFEFWLLLHSDKVFDYNPDELLENKKIGRKRFLEKAVSEVFNGYKKGNIQPERFLPYIRKAIANEKNFCQDLYGLKDRLGSNIGTLLEEFIDPKDA